MRKLVTAGFIALAAPTAAFANTDYLTFSNQTAEQWTLVSYSVSAGATFTRGGLYADPGGYEYSVINVTGPVDYTVTWQGPAPDYTQCVFHGSGHNNQYGNWQTTISATINNSNSHNYQCKTPSLGSGSYYFRLNYGVSY